MKRFWAIAILVVASLSKATAAPDGHEWPTIGRTSEEQFYSPLDDIDVDNVKDLGLAWYHDYGTRRGVEATPLMVDGVLYTTLPWNVTSAIDARTGQVLWTYDPEVSRDLARLACCDIVSRGIAIAEGKVILAALDGRLIALDLKSGQPLWSVQTLEPGWPYTITGAPRIFGKKVFIGNAGADYGVRGYVSAYDLDTGKPLWRFYTVPGDPSKGLENAAMEMAAKTWTGEWWKLGGGGTVWDAITFDPSLNLVYVGTGNGSPWAQQHRSPGGGDNLFLASIVALNADTGEYRWHYQQVPGERFDYTATQPMIHADLKIGGKVRKVLMQAPKNGFFYVLDRETGELISAKNIAAVTWASGIDPATSRPIFTPESFYGEKAVMLAPSFIGAHNWFPMAFSPKTGLVYIPVTETYGIYSAAKEFKPRKNTTNTGGGDGGGTRAERIKMQDLAASLQRTWLSAWDPVAQREVWRVDHPGHARSGGVLATAGNLVFHSTMDKVFAAYRADTGEKMWQVPIDQIALAAPATYMLDGEQYIALNAGYGGGLSHAEAAAGRGPHISSGRLMVFKLGGTGKLPPLEAETAYKPPPKMFLTDEQVEKGRELYDGLCASCHGSSVRGGVKDLRFMDDETRAQFSEIVLHGTRKGQGMAGFADALDSGDVKFLLDYILLRAYEDYGPEQARVDEAPITGK